MIRPLIKLIRVLQSNTAPGEVASGVALSLFFGFTPLNHTHVIFLVLALFFFKINRAATMVFLPLIKLLYYLGFVYLADYIGTFLLIQCDFLEGFWSLITHAPVLSLLDLEYTLVLGGLVLSSVLAFPVYLLAIRGIEAYRSRYQEKVKNSKLLQGIKGLTISKWILSWWPK